MHFFYELTIFWSAQKWRKDTFSSTLHPLSTVIFATAAVLAFVLLHDSRFNFHCYTLHEATPTQKLARKCTATSCHLLRERLQSAFTLANQLCWITQYQLRYSTHFHSSSFLFSIFGSDLYIYYYYYWSLLYSAILHSRADSLHLHVILHEWIAFLGWN